MNYKNLLISRYFLIFKYTGMIIMLAGAAIISPLIFLTVYTEEAHLAVHFLGAGGAALLAGALLYFYGVKNKKEDVELSLNEGSIIVIFSWIGAIIFSAIPFITILDMSLSHSIFEVVSGWTTTGLSLVDVTEAPNLILIWRSIMQFFGGAGLAVIALSSLLPVHGMGLYMAEARSDKLLPHVKRSTMMIMKIYSFYTLAGVFLYYISGMPLFDSINHSMAAISTGGFSTQVDSIGHYNNLQIEIVTIVLMFLGTINFATHYTLLKGKIKTFFKNAEIRFMISSLLLLTPIIMFFSLNVFYPTLGENFRISFFQLVTAISTTGFSTISFAGWPVFANFIIILLMLVGGGTGSTAGGIKQYRIYLIFKSIYWEIKEQFLPRRNISSNYLWRGENKFYIKSEHVKRVANYIMLYIFTFFVGVAIHTAYGYSLLDSMFEFGSALGTVGLSIGLISTEAPLGIIWTQTLGMFLGRLEFLIILYAGIKLFKDGIYIVKND
ncbi:TrkH family potassium uptake protein [Halanaerobium sp. Z-7514]|uniref:TrkH family potassium uptake protein n=1 Tax=Halanaerobium polyolivorans TaxID=2886943 RepID=A0AAW4X0V1_9FIRM|nr:TrkH family potassium uptake protein [Halanaerobium polyolivorans]MCC3145434.1 TrkH family potassium uptake protein [Halanaerobium polyolivorans]